MAAYYVQLNLIKLRLSKNGQRFFGKCSLHDGKLLSFSVGDALDGIQKSKINQLKTKVRIKIESAENNSIYLLKYSDIRTCKVDFPSDRPLFYLEGGSFDDWGYDELTDAGKGYLRHEILFSSGAIILIDFRHFSFERLKNPK